MSKTLERYQKCSYDTLEVNNHSASQEMEVHIANQLIISSQYQTVNGGQVGLAEEVSGLS